MLVTGLKGAYAISAVMFTYIAITFTWTINNMLSRSAVLDSAKLCTDDTWNLMEPHLLILRSHLSINAVRLSQCSLVELFFLRQDIIRMQ